MFIVSYRVWGPGVRVLLPGRRFWLRVPQEAALTVWAMAGAHVRLDGVRGSAAKLTVMAVTAGLKSTLCRPLHSKAQLVSPE